MISPRVDVVASRNVVHAALSLVVVMAGAAAQYLLLAAEFVAVTQVLVYIGAVMVLFLFGVMLTRAKIGSDDRPQQQELGMVGIPVALLLFGVMAYVLIEGLRRRRAAEPTRRRRVTATSATASSSRILLPFWALSFVLLAAVIGAIVLARKD